MKCFFSEEMSEIPLFHVIVLQVGHRLQKASVEPLRPHGLYPQVRYLNLLFQTYFRYKQIKYFVRLIFSFIIGQPFGPIVGHAASKLACLALSSAISCRSSICQAFSPPLGLSPLSYFLVVWSQIGCLNLTNLALNITYCVCGT